MNEILKITAGVDEVGRGSLAGPVVAAAVILDMNRPIQGLADSKKLSEKKREQLAEEIMEKSTAWSVARASVAEIDEMNILQASLLAMQRAIVSLTVQPEYVLVDGNQPPKIDIPTDTVIKGDSKIPAISAASILAKVSRDNEMIEMENRYPGYGFAGHKGYPTRQHLEALEKLGITDIHRQSFSPVRKILEGISDAG